jgi:hypothetical protein
MLLLVAGIVMGIFKESFNKMKKEEVNESVQRKSD